MAPVVKLIHSNASAPNPHRTRFLWMLEHILEAIRESAIIPRLHKVCAHSVLNVPWYVTRRGGYDGMSAGQVLTEFVGQPCGREHTPGPRQDKCSGRAEHAGQLLASNGAQESHTAVEAKIGHQCPGPSHALRGAITDQHQLCTP